MITKNKALIGLMVVTSACICSFALMQNEGVNFAKAEDVIHSVTISCNGNHFPQTTGNCTLINEVGTEINCVIMAPNALSYAYIGDRVSISNSSSGGATYYITLYINGIISCDFNRPSDDYMPIMRLFREDTFYASGLHVEDEEGLSTKVWISIELAGYADFTFDSIVIKYSESKCRELSK